MGVDNVRIGYVQISVNGHVIDEELETFAETIRSSGTSILDVLGGSNSVNITVKTTIRIEMQPNDNASDINAILDCVTMTRDALKASGIVPDKVDTGIDNRRIWTLYGQACHGV